MLRTKQWLTLSVLIGALTGCASLRDHCDEKIMQMKCNQQAKRAWHQNKSLYECVNDRHDFGAGYRQGYIDICMGSDGCTPALPPRSYWSTCHSCEEGQAQILAWFDGYHHGVLAALCNGCSGQCQLLTAFDLYNCHVPPGAEHNLYVEGVKGLEPQAAPDQGGFPGDDYLPHGVPPEPLPYGNPIPDPTPLVPDLLQHPGPQLGVPVGPHEVQARPAGEPESYYSARFGNQTVK